MKRSTILVGLGVLLAISCTKEKDELAAVKSLKVGVASEAPYEVYEPQGVPYEDLEAGLLENLSGEATAATCEVTKGIWLWETGMNYWFPSVEFDHENSFVSGYDEEIIDERMIQLNLISGEFDNLSLRAEFVSTYEDIESRVLDGLAHAVTDVQFVDLQDDVITLRVKSIFYLNPQFTVYPGTPTVPSATVDKMMGYKATCSYGPVQSGAWQDAAGNVKSVIPRPHYISHSKYYSNVFEYSSYAGSLGKRFLDGSYLPGNSNALFNHHSSPAMATTCILISEQNSYAQALANQIDGILVKRTYWDGISRLIIHPNITVPAGNSSWGFYLDLATHYFYPDALVKLRPGDVI